MTLVLALAQGHSSSYILAAAESPCSVRLYTPLMVTFALSSTVSEIRIAGFVRPEASFSSASYSG